MKPLHAPTRSFQVPTEEEYQYLNDTTENSGIDEEDEDFVFTSSSSFKQRSVNNADAKRKPIMYNELVESSKVREYMDLVAQGNRTRRWQYVLHYLLFNIVDGDSAFLRYFQYH
jgi:hypothetical protein